MPDFDPSEMLETSFDGDAFNDHYTPFPETECYARVKSVNVLRGTFKEGQPYLRAQFMFVTDDEHVQQATGLREPQVRYEFFLDTKEGPNGQLTVQTKNDNVNANIRLTKLRNALGLPAGKRFNMAQFDGLSCYIRTKQQPNPQNSDEPYCNVVAVSGEPFRKATR